MAKQVIYRRGTTEQHADFVGANGEVTVDTVKHVTIVHDGVTAGGWPAANATAVNSALAVLTANAANQAASITTLFASAATQANTLANLTANAAAQQVSINAFVLASNSTAIFANIAEVQANVTAANVKIDLLFGNATVQSEAIALANANIIALQSTVANITGANLETITGNLSPSANVTYDLGTPDRRWRDLYLSGNTINLGGASISADNNNITFSGNISYTSSDEWRTIGWRYNNVNYGLSETVTLRLDSPFSPIGPFTGNIVPYAEWWFDDFNGSFYPANVDAALYSLGWTLHGNGYLATMTLSAPPKTITNWNPDGGEAIEWYFYDLDTGTKGNLAGVFGRTLTELNQVSLSSPRLSDITLTSGNITFSDETIQTTAFSNSAVSTYLAEFDGAINFTASPALITGLGNISSAKVWTGNLEFIDGSYQTTANIMAAVFTMANSQHWTSAVSTIGEALNQLAERIYNIENP